MCAAKLSVSRSSSQYEKVGKFRNENKLIRKEVQACVRKLMLVFALPITSLITEFYFLVISKKFLQYF